MAQKRESTALRQKQIVNAARKLIVKYGSEHVTARRIAKELGITEGAIYRHFKSKRDILSLLVKHIENNLIVDIEKGKASGETPMVRLENTLRNHVSAIEQRKGISFQVIAEIVSLGDKRLNKQISATINKYLGRIKDFISEGVEAGEIRQDIDLDAAAMMFFGMIQGLVSVWVLSSYSFTLEQRYPPLWNTFREAVTGVGAGLSASLV